MAITLPAIHKNNGIVQSQSDLFHRTNHYIVHWHNRHTHTYYGVSISSVPFDLRCVPIWFPFGWFLVYNSPAQANPHFLPCVESRNSFHLWQGMETHKLTSRKALLQKPVFWLFLFGASVRFVKPVGFNHCFIHQQQHNNSNRSQFICARSTRFGYGILESSGPFLVVSTCSANIDRTGI